MPIQVEVVPRGVRLEFPDGTPESVISETIRRDFPRNGSDVAYDLKNQTFKPTLEDYRLYEGHLIDNPQLAAHLSDGGAFLRKNNESERYLAFLRTLEESRSETEGNFASTPPPSANSYTAGTTAYASSEPSVSGSSSYRSNTSEGSELMMLSLAIILIGGVISLIAGIRTALRLDRAMRAANPSLQYYRWGYFQGKTLIYMGWVIVVGLLPLFAVFKEDDQVLGLMLFEGITALSIVAGYGVAARKRWGWIVLTLLNLLTVNLILFIVHIIYAAKRWGEFGDASHVAPAVNTVAQPPPGHSPAVPTPTPPMKPDPSEASTKQTSTNVADDVEQFYARAGAELRTGELNDAAWARALAESGGDEPKAKARYVQLRVEGMIQKAEARRLRDMEEARREEERWQALKARQEEERKQAAKKREQERLKEAAWRAEEERIRPILEERRRKVRRALALIAAVAAVVWVVWYFGFSLPEEQLKREAEQREQAKLEAEKLRTQRERDEAARLEAEKLRATKEMEAAQTRRAERQRTAAVLAQEEIARKQIQPLISATEESPFTNTLGMRFVWVNSAQVLFCVWETRVRDYAAYASMNHGINPGWEKSDYYGAVLVPSSNCPVANVSWREAKAFCAWLTAKERREGKLGSRLSYRLPREAEWNEAVGQSKYPWGHQSPPPQAIGNYDDEATFSPNVLVGYRDGFDRTSPVGSFKANDYGLYDMGGNLWEMCEDEFDIGHEYRVIRGGAWTSHDIVCLASDYRHVVWPEVHDPATGFRCVLGVD